MFKNQEEIAEIPWKRNEERAFENLSPKGIFFYKRDRGKVAKCAA